VIDSGTLAFYDPEDERIRVRGTEMSVGLEVTLVHELTHALQDQRFDLDRLNDVTLDGGASTAFRGLGEGDALRIEDEYIADVLTDEEREAYDEEFAAELEESEAATEDVPPFIEAVFGAPYALGKPFVTMLVNKDGNDAVDAAFWGPPETEEHLLDPASFLDEEEPAELELELPDDVEVFEESSFGASSLYLVLAERIDPKVALQAAVGWNGDARALFERDGVACVQAAFRGDSDEDEDEIEAALEEWHGTLVGDSAELITVDGHPGFEACDPGTDVDLELTGRSDKSLFLPNLWGYLIADAATTLAADESRCYAETVIETLTYDEITDPDGAAFSGDDFQQTLSDAYESCA
jgi:hypothetical protein